MTDAEEPATRHVTLRDGRLEGEPDLEPDAVGATREERAMKDNQRDLTSLSGPLEGEARARTTADGRAID